MSIDITNMIDLLRVVDVTSAETIAIAIQIVDSSLMSRDISPIVADEKATYRVLKNAHSELHYIVINDAVLIKVDHFAVYDDLEPDADLAALIAEIAVDKIDNDWFMVVGNAGMEVVHELMGLSPKYIEDIRLQMTIKDKIEIQNVRRQQVGSHDPLWSVEYKSVGSGMISSKLINYEQVEERLIYDAKQNLRKQVRGKL